MRVYMNLQESEIPTDVTSFESLFFRDIFCLWDITTLLFSLYLWYIFHVTGYPPVFCVVSVDHCLKFFPRRDSVSNF